MSVLLSSADRVASLEITVRDVESAIKPSLSFLFSLYSLGALGKLALFSWGPHSSTKKVQIVWPVYWPVAAWM
jgi:hypothetical protein